MSLEDLPNGLWVIMAPYLDPMSYWSLLYASPTISEKASTDSVRSRLSLLAAGQDILIRPNDTPQQAVDRMLPLARLGNVDAILMLALVAIYFYDDLFVGLALLYKARSTPRCKHEVANILIRARMVDPKQNELLDHVGEILRDEQAANGYPLAIIESQGCNDNEGLLQKSRHELAKTS